MPFAQLFRQGFLCRLKRIANPPPTNKSNVTCGTLIVLSQEISAGQCKKERLLGTSVVITGGGFAEHVSPFGRCPRDIVSWRTRREQKEKALRSVVHTHPVSLMGFLKICSHGLHLGVKLEGHPLKTPATASDLLALARLRSERVWSRRRARCWACLSPLKYQRRSVEVSGASPLQWSG